MSIPRTPPAVARTRSDAELAMQAEEFQRMVLEDAMDEQGIVRHHLRANRKPLTDSDLKKQLEDRRGWIASGKECHPLLGTPAYAMYEVCLRRDHRTVVVKHHPSMNS